MAISQELFDKHIKDLVSQRVKHYLFDIIYFINLFSKPIHFLKKKLKFFRNKKINMGCGATYLYGWINIDGNPFRKKDMWLDLRSKWPFDNETISGFVAAHVIEHLYDEELEHFGRELNRVLRKGAFVHIEVPSLEILIKKYLIDVDGKEFNKTCFWYGAHHQIFDGNRLSHYLSKFGFKVEFLELAIKKSKYLTPTELDKICLRPEESLLIEAVKI